MSGHVQDTWCTFSELIEWDQRRRDTAEAFLEWLSAKDGTPFTKTMDVETVEMPLGIKKVCARASVVVVTRSCLLRQRARVRAWPGGGDGDDDDACSRCPHPPTPARAPVPRSPRRR
jgi:hypothetical protein